jgi:hypothetical protein
MRLTLMALLIASCGDSTPNNSQPDLSALADLATSNGDMVMLPTLTVDNTLAWCTVTVTLPGQTAVTFSGASMSFMAASGATVMLHAVPNPTFMPVKWTGTTTMAGADATYVMTGAAAQSVTACCALSTGTGC